MAMATSPQSTAAAPNIPPLRREFRGVWVATVANIDWPTRPGLSVAQMRQEMVAIMDRCKELNLNAVIFQIRPSADALYRSDIEPWSWYLTGESGKAPAENFDPLQFAIQEAHRRGIELHVWCNPYRAGHPNQKGEFAASHISKTNPNLVKRYGTFLWMDPAEPAVQKRSFDVFMDLVERYDIDGLHIDDYFYPYPVTENGQKVDFPDEPSWQRYVQSGGRLNRGDWRRKNVDDFIERVYKGIKQRKPWVRFGISPFGIYRPGIPEGIRAGVDQYGELYADALKWYREGWSDYFTPQLYWPIAQTPQSYPVLLNWWASQNAKNRHLWVGNFTSRTNPAEGNWKAQDVVDQINLTRRNGVSKGNVHFSMKAFLQNWNGISDALKNGPYADAAVPPATPWLGAAPPAAPTIERRTRQGANEVITLRKPETVRFFAVQYADGTITMTSSPTITIDGARGGWVAVRALSRTMIESPATVVRPR